MKARYIRATLALASISWGLAGAANAVAAPGMGSGMAPGMAPGMAMNMPGMSMGGTPAKMDPSPPASAAAGRRMSHEASPKHRPGPSAVARSAVLATALPITPPVVVHLAADAPVPGLASHLPGMMPVMDRGVWLHGILDEFEGRYAPGASNFRWDGEAWYGGDYNRLWVKSEGTLASGRGRGSLSDGDQEALYSRAITRYFDIQGGVRVDLDDGPARTWAAFGIQGLALYQFEVQATGYVSDRGRFASRIEGSYDLLLTNRLILQPQAEINLYTRADPARQVGAGLSDIDTGLRLRYEFWRKFAPYVAVTYAGSLAQARHIVRAQDMPTGTTRFTFGIRTWF